MQSKGAGLKMDLSSRATTTLRPRQINLDVLFDFRYTIAQVANQSRSNLDGSNKLGKFIL